MDRASTIRRVFGWLCYLASAVPFSAFVAEAFLSGLGHDDARMLVVNLLIFAAAGVAAVLVKNTIVNAFMALNAWPYADFLFHHYGSDPSMWSSNDIEGSTIYVSLYCLTGMVAGAVWLLYRAPSLWRRLVKASLN